MYARIYVCVYACMLVLYVREKVESKRTCQKQVLLYIFEPLGCSRII